MADSAAEFAAIAKSKASEEGNPPVELSVDPVTTTSHQKLPEESELFTETRREALVEPSVDSNQKTPEELVAKAIAPIKREFLRPPPSRTANESVADSDATQCGSGLVKEKKSKRQLKRERQQERNSASNLCPEIAKTGDASACRYGDKCHSSHDIEAFKAQKPDDLDGECPFTVAKAPCPYGFSCRFFGTHKDGNAATSANALNKITELNGLSKDVQKALWKKKVKFTKADAVLKSLGLMAVKFKPKAEIAEEEKCTVDNQVSDENKSVKVDNDLIVKSESPSEDLVEDNIDEMCPANDLRPKVEIADEEKCTVDNLQVSDENNSVKVDNDLIVKSESPSEDLAEDNIDEMCPANDLRPFKKAKSSDDVRNSYDELKNGGSAADEKNSCSDLENGKAELEKDMDRNGAKTEPISTLDDRVTKPEGSLKIHPRERKLIDFSGKLYLAPLTTVGNLPFRRICKSLGADVTCGEMAMCTNLLQGQASEWALLRRHQCEDLFGVQICGAYPDTIARAVELIERECTVDFIDINMGCPIDIVVNKGAGSSLLSKPMRMKNIVEAASATVEKPITIKVRTGYFEGKPRIDSLIKDIANWGTSAVTVHGRSRQQRYSKLADWDYVYQCARKAPDTLQVLGNGDVFSYSDWNKHIVDCPKLSSCMIARGALIKPWIFTEIKEQRDWDISSEERLNILKDYARYGLQHWGSDTKGVETTRHFLLEWLSYTCRYIPVGLLDVIPQRLNWRPPSYYGRNDLETLMASDSAADWIRISEMLLGKVPAGFTFSPKHKSNAYDRAENG